MGDWDWLEKETVNLWVGGMRADGGDSDLRRNCGAREKCDWLGKDTGARHQKGCRKETEIG